MENNTLLNKLENINEQLNLTHYWIILLKYKRILILAPSLFCLLGFFIALNINPIFQSQATLVIEESTKEYCKYRGSLLVVIEDAFRNLIILITKFKF